MYVCMCNGYTDQDIKNTVRAGGVTNAEETYIALGEGFCCGACHDCACDLVEKELANQVPVAAE